MFELIAPYATETAKRSVLYLTIINKLVEFSFVDVLNRGT